MNALRPFFRRLCAVALVLPAWVGLGVAPLAAQEQAAQAPTITAAADNPAPVTAATSYSIEQASQAPTAVIGSHDPALNYKLQAYATLYGAGIWWVTLSDYQWQPMGTDPYAVLRDDLPDGSKTHQYHLAARWVSIDGQSLSLADARWEQVAADMSSVTYAVRVLDAAGQAVLQIRRTLRVEPDSYEIRCEQELVNFAGRPLRVVFEQNAFADIAQEEGGYMGDRRELAAGYFNLQYDPARQRIYSENTHQTRAKVLDHGTYWPTPGLPAQHELAWLAMVNRYFAVAVHAALPPTGTPVRTLDIPPLTTSFAQVGVDVRGGQQNKTDLRHMALTLTSQPIDLPAGGAARLDLALFAGPRSPDLFDQQPYKALCFNELVVYNLGGMCAFCTFQWLAKGLLAFLKGIHFVVRDWGLAIIVLVLVVRAVLHPITRRAQVNMAKMQKQMAALQPEMEKLKKKYKDDQSRLQQETMRLYRERGVNPLNMLGCLPMFLQMPIWIALYAMLYYAIELRHEPAFYGIFQAVTAGHWPFLADLSSADQFVRFPGKGFTLNLIFIHPTFAGINILPLLMAVVFFIQQKFTMAPPANEQAAQQQKIMMWMTLLFPVFLYSAPSGLNLYILASTGAGIIDSYLVKRHIKKEEEAGTLFAPKKPSGASLMGRLQKLVEQRQKVMDQRDQLPRRRE